MNPREYLLQLRLLRKTIDSNVDEINKLRSLCSAVPTTDFSKEKVSGGEQSDKIATLVSKIIDLENEIQAEIDEAVDLEREIRTVINRQENEAERLLLKLRYIDFNTWEEVAEKMNYSVMQIWRIHNSALKNLDFPG